MNAVTPARSVGLSVGAFALSGIALTASALFALGVLAPPSHVGGPGTTSQIGSLRTEGNLHVDSNASISGSLDVTGPATMSSLSASGNALLNSVKLTGALNSESTLTGTQFLSTVATGHAPMVVNSSTLVNNLHASNADQLGGADPGFYVNTGGAPQTKSGGLSVGSLVTGPLTAGGATNLGGPLSVTGLTTLNGTLNVNGATNLALVNIINLAVANAVNIGGPLTAGGNTALNGSLNVAGPTALANGLNVSGPTTLANGLGVTGDTSLHGALNVAGATALGAGLSVTGNTSSTGVVTAGAGLVASSGGLTVSGPSTITGNTTINGAATVNGPAAINGPASIANDLLVGGNSHVVGTSALDGVATVGTAGHTGLALQVNGDVATTGSQTIGTLLTSTVQAPAGSDLTLTTATPGRNLLIPNTVGNITLNAAGDLKTAGSLTATTNVQGVQLISTVLTGTAPLQVSSTTLVPNLHVANADAALTAGSATTATTAATANNALNLGGQLPSFYLDTSATGQTKAGQLTLGAGGLHVTTAPLSTFDNGVQVGTLHDVGTLTVDGSAQFNGTVAVVGNSQFTGTVAVAGAPIGTYKLTVNGSTILTGDVAGGNQFRGLTTLCTLVGAVETCSYQGGVTLGSAPKSIIVTPAGDYGGATRYWIPALLPPTTTAFTVQFNSNPGAAIQFYYVVVQ